MINLYKDITTIYFKRTFLTENSKVFLRVFYPDPSFKPGRTQEPAP